MEDWSDNTVIYVCIGIAVTMFVGGYFIKWLGMS